MSDSLRKTAVRRISLVLLVGLAFPLGRAAAELPASVPNPQTRWGAAEYEQLAEVLLAKKMPLPTLSNPETKELFGRMISLENLKTADDASLPITRRLQEIMHINGSNAEILKLYGDAIEQKEKLGSEGARELGFSLQLSASLYRLMEALIPTLPHDQSYLARLLGREQLRLGILQQIVGVVASLGETELYSADDRSYLLKQLDQTLPVFDAVCRDDVRAELKREVESARSFFPAAADQKVVDSIVQRFSKPAPEKSAAAAAPVRNPKKH